MGFSGEDADDEAGMSDATGSSVSRESSVDGSEGNEKKSKRRKKESRSLPAAVTSNRTPFFSMFSLFEGSPTYKQRRKKNTGTLGNIVVPNLDRLLDDGANFSSLFL